MKKSALALTYRNIFQGKNHHRLLSIIQLVVNSSVVSGMISNASVIRTFNIGKLGINSAFLTELGHTLSHKRKSPSKFEGGKQNNQLNIEKFYR